MLDLDAITYQHSGTELRYSFNLKLSAGERIAIMGASGSGKSTLLDLIAGFLLPVSGSMTWHGADLLSVRPEERPTAILFQKDNLFDHISAIDNVGLGLSRNGRMNNAQRAQAVDALKLVGLAGREDQLASTLSGGQQQRVALARTLVRDRPILLMDEPFTGLDDDTKAEMLALVTDMATRHGKAILMVTHDRSDADEFADRILTLSNGRLSE